MLTLFHKIVAASQKYPNMAVLTFSSDRTDKKTNISALNRDGDKTSTRFFALGVFFILRGITAFAARFW